LCVHYLKHILYAKRVGNLRRAEFFLNLIWSSPKGIVRLQLGQFFFFEKTKLAHPNWHQRESNLRPQEEAHFQVPNQYLQFASILWL